MPTNRRPPTARRTRQWTAILSAAALFTAPAVALAQDSAHVEALIQDAARRFAAADQQSSPPQPQAGPHAPSSASHPLTLDQAVALALSHNLDIAVQRENPSTFDLQLAGLKAAYLPIVTSLVGDQRQVATPTTLLTGGQRVTTTTGTFNAALNEAMPWAGGSFNLSWSNNRVSSNSFFFNYNPAFNSTVTAQYTQPLLRGLRTDALRQQLVVTKANRQISDLQLQTTIVNTLTSVKNSYWDLVFAVDSIDVAKKAVELAHQLTVENQKRVSFGTMAPLDLVSAQSQEATSQHTLVQAEGNRRLAELALKRLLVAGPEDPLWTETLDPTDRPADAPVTIDIEATVRRALADRKDLAQARQQAAADETTYAYLRDQTRPQADVVGSYAVGGIGGTQILREGTDPLSAFTSPAIGTVPGGFGDALSSAFGANYPTWGLALNVTYPIHYSAARAEVARAEVQRRQVAIQIRQLEVQVVTDVTNAAIQVRSDLDGLHSATLARQLAQQKLDVEEKKFAVGMSTNYFIVQAQRDLADAQNAELLAEVNYRKSLVEFDRAQQTTLQASGVTLVTPAGLTTPSSGSGRPAVAAPSAAFIP